MPQKIIGGNRDVNGKIVLIGLSPQEGSEALYALTQRQIMALVSLSDPLAWTKRHLYLPDDLNNQSLLNDWVEDTKVRLMTPLDFCGLMIENAECFLTDETVIDQIVNGPLGSALGNVIGDIIINNQRTLPSGQANYNLFDEIDDCDPDKVFNVCYKIVEYLHNMTGQLFAAIEQLTNIGERVALFFQATEAETSNPTNEIYEFFDQLISNVQEEYEARFSIGGVLHYKIACDLFCLFRDDCDANIGDVAKYYISKVDTEISDTASAYGALNAVSSYILTGNLPLDSAVYAFHLLCLSVINSNKPFLDNNFFSLLTVIKAAQDEKNNDWTEYCDDCNNTWCRHLDDAHDLGTLFVGTGGLGAQALYYGGKWHSNPSLIPSRISLELDMLDQYDLTSIRIVFDGPNEESVGNYVAWYHHHFGGAIDSDVFTEDVTLYALPFVNARKFDIDVVSSFGPEVPITVGITDIYITGINKRPDWGEPC